MKARKPNESDASYIARLEAQNAGLKANNDALSKANNLFTTKGRQAASFAGTVLNAAAEATGTTDDPRVVAALACFDGLAGAPWSKDIPVPDMFPDFGGADIMARGGDCEMILKSAFEAVEAHTDSYSFYCLLKGLPKERQEFVAGLICTLHRMAVANLADQARAATGSRPLVKVVVPEIETLEQAREVIYDLWMEVGNTLSDIGMSQSILRLDLRAGMYAEAFRHIGDAINAAERAAHNLPRAPEEIPW